MTTAEQLAAALREAYSYALEGSTPKVATTRLMICDLAREALARYDADDERANGPRYE